MNHYRESQLQEFTNSSAIIDWQPTWSRQSLSFSQKFPNQNRKFNLYLQYLSLFSFEFWLSNREPNLKLNLDNASLFKPELANILDVICQIELGDFKVCLIPTLDARDSEVMIPRYAIDIPEFMAHFYVLVEIDESLEISVIKGFIDRERLANHRDSYALDLDWNYSIPVELFNFKIEKLLVNCRCLKADSIALPQAKCDRNLIELQTELKQVLPTIKHQLLWKKLTWSQAVTTVTNPDLRTWLYRSLTNNKERFNLYLGDLLKLLTKPAIDLHHWIQTQMEELDPELTWQMLPSQIALSAMRDVEQDNPAVSLNYILTQISTQTKIEIGNNIGQAYQEFNLNSPLRLYAVTWVTSEIKETWALLLILGSPPQYIPPYGVKLRVSDLDNIVQEQELTTTSGGAYLCTHLEANSKDKLLVTITSPDNTTEISRLFEFRF